MPLPIETPRLILRPFEAGDAAAFSAYRSDPAVARYQGWDAPFSLPQADRFISELKTTRPGTPGEWYQTAITLKSTGVLIGDCGFIFLEEDPDQAEIGFTLARAYQGQGYAFEAVSRMLGYLFGEWPALHRVRANCDPANHASARLLTRLGMRHEGHFIESLWLKGAWVSEDWYAILRREWNQ